MVKSKTTTPIAIMLIVIMMFSMVLFNPVETSENKAIAAPGDGWDLTNFVTSVTMWDLSTTPPTQMIPGGTTYIGQNYRFDINFAETPALQFAYSGGFLTFQLPSQLNIQNTIQRSPIYGQPPAGSSNPGIIGWYTIDTNGLVQVQFDNVKQDGTPTENGSNFINYYTNAFFRLQITAQLTESGDSSIDFGNGGEVNIRPPIPPPARLTVNKTSRYDPSSERIYYMITITAIGAPVSNIVVNDAPSLNGNTTATNTMDALYGFRYDLNGNTDYQIPMVVTPFPANNAFQYNFGSLTLAPGNYITIRYYLDIPTFIARNPPLNLLSYDFNIGNQVVVHSTAPDVGDTTVDHVKKTFPITKTGTLVPGSPPGIRWTITAGNGTMSTLLNPASGGRITDKLTSPLLLPTPNLINISFYDSTDTLIGASPYTANLFPGNFVDAPDGFTFDVPLSTDSIPGGLPGDTFGNICKIEIEFITAISPPPTIPGQPPVVYYNNVSFNDQGTGGRYPFAPGLIPMTKETSGIICDAPGSYYVNYKITFTIPAGLEASTFYLHDILKVNGVVVPNNPVSLTATAVEAGTTTALLGFAYSYETIANNLRVYLTSSVLPPTYPSWDHVGAADVTVEYRINLTPAQITALSGSNAAQLTNTVYLINDTSGNPILSGDNQNMVGGTSVNDSWPIQKTATVSGNPSLFDYTVILKGAFSSRTTPLLQNGFSPVFSDTFDSRLEYVPGSLYFVDPGDNSNPRKFFVPITDPPAGGTTISANLTSMRQFSGPPQQGGTLTGSAPANWFAVRRNIEVHYQLRIRDQYLENDGLPPLRNTATILVNTGACSYSNDANVAYVPKPLSKNITLDGSNLAKVDIIINPDGGFIFSDGSSPGPAEITAKDELDNMMVYLDSIEVFTQTKVGATWDGIWKPQPVTINDRTLWSANVVNLREVDFIIPNGTPVEIKYDALVTIPLGDIGTIGNKISIYGETVTDGSDNYQVNDSLAGGGGSMLPVKAFKQDNVGNVLTGATFNLYLGWLSEYGAPVGLESAPTISVNGKNFYQIVGDTNTDSNGTAVFSNNWITSNYDFIFLLVETKTPYNYEQPTGINAYTFFTVNPLITPATLRAQEVLLNLPLGKINQTSDFVTVSNTPIPSPESPPNSLRVRKEFIGLTNAQIQQNMQNFRIQITGPGGFSRSIGLNQAIAGVTFENIQEGTYFFTEANATMPGYNMTAVPQLPFRRFVIPNSTGAVTVQISNEYSLPPIPSPQTGDERNLILPVAMVLFGITCIGGAELFRRHYRKRKNK